MLRHWARRFFRDDGGSVVVEYVVTAAVVALIMLIGFEMLGDAISSAYGRLEENIGGAMS